MKLLPEVFDSYFVRNAVIHNYSTRQCDELHAPLYKTQVGQLSFYYNAVSLWISIGHDLLNAGNYNGMPRIGIYKKSLKQYLLNL